MKRIVLILLLLMLAVIGYSQSVFWEETFTPQPTDWTLEDNWAFIDGTLQLSWNPTATDYDLSAISPIISLPDNVGEVIITQFLDEYSASNEIISIGVVVDGNASELWQYELTNGDWGSQGGSNIALSLEEYAGQDIQLKFRSYGASTWNFESWRIYNVKITALLNNDLAIDSITGSTFIEENYEGQWSVVVKNSGLNIQDNYVVKLFKYGDEEIASIAATSEIQSGETAIFYFNWTPTEIENTFLYGKVILDGDEFSSNNISNYHYLRIHSGEQLNVLILDSDNNSHYVSPESGQSVGCEYGIKKSLGVNGITYSTVMELPEDLSPYDIVFIELGLWCLSCSATPPGTVSFNDQLKLITYLDNGGSVYIEGADVAFNHYEDPFFNYFGTNFVDTGAENGISSLVGEAGTFADGLEYNFQGGSDAHYKIDQLSANVGTAFLKSEDEKVRAVYNQTDTYRTICSSTILGAFFDGNNLNIKAYLMGEYINFLTNQPTSINENSVLPTMAKLGQNYPNPFNPTTTISFQIPHQSNVKLTIYNLKGERIKTLLNKNIDSGYHQVIWNGKNDNGKDAVSGIYFYKLTSQSYNLIQKMILMK